MKIPICPHCKEEQPITADNISIETTIPLEEAVKCFVVTCDKCFNHFRIFGNLTYTTKKISEK